MVARVCVVGAGVIGLSSAVALQEQLALGRLGSVEEDVTITLIAENFTPNTTSDGALGLWEPYMVGDTAPHKIKEWGDITFKHMLELVRSEEGPEAGTFLVSGISLWKKPVPDPVWKDCVLGFKNLTPRDLVPYPEYRHGWHYTSAVSECRLYLPWLMKRFKKNGGVVEKRRISSLAELGGQYDIVVNCTGLGARSLTDDKQLEPLRGHVIRVAAPWVKHFINADDDDLYILPGADYVVLGGTHDLGKWGTSLDPATSNRILHGCQKLRPSLKSAHILKEWVGLRPSRSTVRLEREELLTLDGPQKVVHNYGHGGAGITLHWGCAMETSRLIAECLTEIKYTAKL